MRVRLLLRRGGFEDVSDHEVLPDDREDQVHDLCVLDQLPEPVGALMVRVHENVGRLGLMWFWRKRG